MATDFSTRLRDWRQRRGVSQLRLAADAAVSQRHLSFLETGRAKPSREMVVHLAAALDVPLRERNVLLAAAGYAPLYSESQLTGPEMGQVRDVLTFLLDAHEPYPAVVMDRRWDVVMTNGGAMHLMLALFGGPPPFDPPLNLLRLSLHPDGVRNQVHDWESLAATLLRRYRRDAAAHPSDTVMRDLLDEVTGYPEVEGLDFGPEMPSPDDLLISVRYRVGDAEVGFFSTVSTIGAAHDVTLAELHLETFFPADAASEQRWRAARGTA